MEERKMKSFIFILIVLLSFSLFPSILSYSEDNEISEGYYLGGNSDDNYGIDFNAFISRHMEAANLTADLTTEKGVKAELTSPQVRECNNYIEIPSFENYYFPFYTVLLPNLVCEADMTIE